jgi:delta 1-pyrroline-5-carboxylate dehydrogenase
LAVNFLEDATAMYTSLEHYIDGNWVKPSGDKSQDVMNPATSKPIGQLGHVSRGDLDKALAAADKAFKQWRKVSAFERGKIRARPPISCAPAPTRSPRFSPRSRARC